jgi:hypothetical protein
VIYGKLGFRSLEDEDGSSETDKRGEYCQVTRDNRKGITLPQAQSKRSHLRAQQKNRDPVV